jgi:septum formation protein
MFRIELMLVLASSSPRRQELLRNARIEFRIQPADIPEIRRAGEPAVDFARRLAREKATTAFETLVPPGGDYVLGADTVVAVAGEVLGKPADDRDAFRMLRLLSGHWHQVTTGVCLLGLAGPDKATGSQSVFEDVRAETTEVFFTPLTDEEIYGYIATGETKDKAGAYAIQGVASRWIPQIRGDYFNVMGLPVALVFRMLQEHGGTLMNESRAGVRT